MTERKTAGAWAGCLLALAGAAGAGPAAAASLAGCEAVPAEARSGAPQDPAVSRTGRIPGLGTVSGAIEWDNRKHLTLTGAGFTLTRTHIPLTGEVEITLAGRGEEPLVIRLGGSDRLRVSRGKTVTRGAAAAQSAGALLGGRAVAAFREQIGNYERQLIAGDPIARLDDPHAHGFLLVGAFLSSLAGDPTAVGRARDLVMRRIRGKMQAARFDFKDCVTDYELYLLQIDTQRTQCLGAANGRETWYGRAADRLGCEVEFMAGAMAGEGQFIGCTSLGVFK